MTTSSTGMSRIHGSFASDFMRDERMPRHLDHWDRALAASGASRGDIASAVGINPYFLDDVLVPAKRMSRAALERALERLYQADLLVKTSRVEPELQLSRLVQALAEAR